MMNLLTCHGNALIAFLYLVFFGRNMAHNGQILAVWIRPSGDRVGDGRPQQSPGWAAGAGVPSSASSVWTGSDGNLIKTS